MSLFPTTYVDNIFKIGEVEKICRSCKFWHGQIYWDNKTTNGPCKLVELDDSLDRLAYISIETDYPEFLDTVVLNTSSEFGCNQWEEEE